MEAGVEVKFEIGLRKNIGANVAPLHYEVSELRALSLPFLHPLAYFGNCRDVRHRSTRFSRADLFFGIIIIHEQADVILHAHQFGMPPAAQFRHCFGIVNIHTLLQTMPGESSIHRTRIDVNVAERARDQFGVGALAAGAGAVDGYNDRTFGYTHSPANNSSSSRVLPETGSRSTAPGPEGGLADNF